MEKRVVVRKDICVGCGVCTSISNILIIGDDGLAEAINEIVSEDKIKEIEEASESCPVKAIEIE